MTQLAFANVGEGVACEAVGQGDMGEGHTTKLQGEAAKHKFPQ